MKAMGGWQSMVGVLCVAFLAGVGCGGGDDEGMGPHHEPGVVSLHHDSVNVTAPELQGGTYEGAAWFSPERMGDLAGGELMRIEYYVMEVPELCRVKVYGPGGMDSPGELLYSADVGESVRANSWNIHELESAITLTGEDVWIAVEFGHGANQRTLGCDAGPAADGGDWLYTAEDGAWRTLQERMPPTSINWNIRGVVSGLP